MELENPADSREGEQLVMFDCQGCQSEPVRGDVKDQGSGDSAGVMLAVVGFGVLGLLTGGTARA